MKQDQSEHYSLLIRALLPQEIFDYFEIVKVTVTESTISVHLDELNNPPTEGAQQRLVSKGFYPESIIQDFPLRERAMFLQVRRRKWQDSTTGEIVSNRWETTAQGTRYTKGFRGVF